MPLSKYALDKFVSQYLSQLTQCNLHEVTSRFSQADSWVSNFVLNTILGCQVDQKAKRFAFAFLRRAEAAFVEYDHARQALTEFVDTGSRKPSVYFRALNHFEAAIGFLYQAYDLRMRFMSVKLFQKGDGTSYNRLNSIYNKGRHFKPADLPADHLHAIWITNDGIQIDNCGVSFMEVEDFLMEIGRLADRISSLSQGQTST